MSLLMNVLTRKKYQNTTEINYLKTGIAIATTLTLGFFAYLTYLTSKIEIKVPRVF